jgi:hypothetical protein
MSHKRVIHWILLLMLAAGLFDGGTGLRGAMHPLAGFAISYLCFLWYCADSDTRGFARSRWLSMGVAGFTLWAIPWYLLRSRAAGQRGSALKVYFSCLVLCPLAFWAGAAIRVALP